LFVIFFLTGSFLAFFQAELFTAFLWLVEFTIIFIFLLILFFLNIKGFSDFSKITYNNNFLYFIFLFCFFNFFDFNQNVFIFDYYVLYDNFYEAIYNNSMNDLFSLFLGFYFFNSFEFILIGFLLFIGSIFCVNFFKLNGTINIKKNISFFNFFSFYKNYLNFFFYVNKI
jgi:hypothetical protein